MILSHLNADAERTFSAINCAKKQTTKQYKDIFAECNTSSKKKNNVACPINYLIRL